MKKCFFISTAFAVTTALLGCNRQTASDPSVNTPAQQALATQDYLSHVNIQSLAPSIQAALADTSTPSSATTAAVNQMAAVRFLWKSAFGPTRSDVADIKSLGYAGYVNKQLSLAPGKYSNYMLDRFGYHNDVPSWPLDIYCNGWASGLVNAKKVPVEQRQTCSKWVTHSYTPSYVFIKSAVHDADQLRMRVAFALSQILVVSNSGIGYLSAPGLLGYQQLLRDHAFGYYDDLLKAVTKNPFMGSFLNLAGSKGADRDRNIAYLTPNQNYARELLQLFSIGLYKMRNDGSYILDENKKPIENYNDFDINEYARALSGWVYPKTLIPNTTYHNTWEGRSVFTSFGYDAGYNASAPLESDYTMSYYMPFHDINEKTLLNGVTIPANQIADKDLDLVVESLMNHPNIAPFVSQALIQFLVSSNPSPGFISRISKVFNTPDINGKKGNLALVVRAILLDEEALNPPDYGGKLLEPVVWVAGITRSSGGVTDGIYPVDFPLTHAGQIPFNAPSVFSFFLPSYRIEKYKIVAPEFGILSANTASNFISSLEKYIGYDYTTNTTDTTKFMAPVGYASGTYWTFPQTWLNLAEKESDISALVQLITQEISGIEIDAQYLSFTEQKIKEKVPLANTNLLKHARVRYAIFLIISSPTFAVRR